MRISASSLKGKSHLIDRPRAGTRIGEVYDYFVARPCRPVHIRTLNLILCGGHQPPSNHWHGCREKLLQYGLDIRRHSYGRWWLVAIQDRDLMAEQLAEEAA